MYPYGLIGNCQISALISAQASIDWLCMPRPDSPPFFGALLDEDGGYFRINPCGDFKATQSYLRNTNILCTHFVCSDESRFEVIDFCPRFEQYGRMYRPSTLIRIIRPLSGAPRLSIDCQPVDGWSKERCGVVRGNSHIDYKVNPSSFVRLTTNIPLTYLHDRIDFQLQDPLYIALSWGSGIDDDLSSVCNSFLEKTTSYWQKWVKHCTVPSEFQSEVIRSALALKLHCFEDTGAILASISTSLPEEIGGERNWDYRFCWIRDAFFTLSAFHSLGHFEEMEGFLKFIADVVDFETPLSPVYALDRSIPSREETAALWGGYRQSKPVRYLNAAASQVQNDAYGEVLLALNPIFRDERFYHLRTPQLERVVGWLTQRCIDSIGKVDAGLWELRDSSREHSFTNLMCWAGIDRVLAAVKAGTLSLTPSLEQVAEISRRKAVERIEAASIDGILRNGPGDETLDSSLLLLSVLRFPDIALRRKTLDGIMAGLAMSGHSDFLMRYARKDDFGVPASAFLICSFWLIQSLAREGRVGDAKALFQRMLRSGNYVGLFSEHFDPHTQLQLGNFPQCYTHVGIINAAFAVSSPWEEVL